MHQPSTIKRDSVFYDYKIHPFVRPPEMDGPTDRTPVVIVGAGPIGMVLALLLAKWGVRTVILEAEAQVSEGSRAVAFTRRSQEILQLAGAIAPFIQNGLTWNSGRSYYKGKEIYHMVIPDDPDDRYRPVLNNSQQYWEEYLSQFCEENPLIDLRWQSAFTSLTDSAKGAQVSVDTPEGEYRIDCNWVVACDGGRSAVRRHLGLRMEGVGYEGKFVITDFRAKDMDLPIERRVFFDPDWNMGNNVIVHRQPNDIWRFDYRVPDGEAPEYTLDPDTIRTRTRLIMEMLGRDVDWELDWATIYSPNTKSLASYRHGHVLFAGDAGHLLPVFGVRGANTGLQDSENLAWSLGLIEAKGAPDSLLDNYSAERVQAAFEICDEAGKSTRIMDPPTKGYRLMRQVILSFSLSQDFCKVLLDWRTSRPHEYRDSLINAGADDDGSFAGGFAKGCAVRNAKLGEQSYLFDHFEFRFQLLVFSRSPKRAEADPLSGFKHRDLVNVIAIGAAMPGADAVISCKAEHLFQKYGIEDEGLYLIRPDMHVCGRWTRMAFAEADAELERILKKGAGR